MYKHILVTTCQFVPSSNFQVKLKNIFPSFQIKIWFWFVWFSNKTLASDDTNLTHIQTTSLPRENQRDQFKTLLQKPLIGNPESCRLLSVTVYNMDGSKIQYFHYTTVKGSYSKRKALEKKKFKFQSISPRQSPLVSAKIHCM